MCQTFEGPKLLKEKSSSKKIIEYFYSDIQILMVKNKIPGIKYFDPKPVIFKWTNPPLKIQFIAEFFKK